MNKKLLLLFAIPAVLLLIGAAGVNKTGVFYDLNLGATTNVVSDNGTALTRNGVPVGGGSTNLTDSGTNVLAQGGVRASALVATNAITAGSSPISTSFSSASQPVSSLLGWSINKASSSSNFMGVAYQIDGNERWSQGIDYENYDFVVAYGADAITTYGPADAFRISQNRKIVMGPAVASPTNNADRVTILRGNTEPGLKIKEWASQLDVADALTIQRQGDAGTQWIAWSQGNTTTDWRVGEEKTGSTYDFTFYYANGGASAAASPGTKKMWYTPGTGFSSAEGIAGTYVLGGYLVINGGNVYLTSSGSGIMKMANSGGNDFYRLQFGGSDTNYPALVRNATTLEAKLADNSAYTGFAAGTITASGSVLASTLVATNGVISTNYVDASISTSNQTTNRIVANFAFQIDCSGTDYSITTTMTNAVMGTTSPSITIPVNGTYLLNVDLAIGGSVNVGDEYVVQLYDVTNNELLGGANAVDQHTAGDHNFLSVTRIYSESSAPATLWLQAANMSGSRGSIISTNTSIRYVKLY